jgi:hypothetical protein
MSLPLKTNTGDFFPDMGFVALAANRFELNEGDRLPS